MRSAPEIRAAWLAQLFSTAAADRPRAEAAVRALYAAAGFAAPRHFLWFDSPFAASWAVAVLAARCNRCHPERSEGPTVRYSWLATGVAE